MCTLSSKERNKGEKRINARGEEVKGKMLPLEGTESEKINLKGSKNPGTGAVVGEG